MTLDRPVAIFAAVAAVVLVVATIICAGNLWENVDANEIAVIQAPMSGKLSFYTTAGTKWQGFGKVTKYEKRDQFWFSSANSDGKQTASKPIKVRFNDGAHADISGSIAWELPIDEKQLTELHTKYGSMEAIEQQLIRTTIEKCVYMTGPLMSSAESYASRRNELLSLIDDQIKYGVYKTESHEERQKDPMTLQEKTVRVVRLIPSNAADDHGFMREDGSPVGSFGIQTLNLSLNEVTYDATVEAQIQKQQEAVMQVQTAIATAKQAEQKAITVAKEGEAEAAKAKWEQEVIKAREVTSAEQRKSVAQLDVQTAELTKQKEVLLGEGEAKRRQLVMEADGALDKKLDAYIKVNEMYAKAIASYTGNWVPQVQMGGSLGGQASSGGTMDFLNLFAVKAAKDLALDLSPTPRHRTVTSADSAK